MAYGFMSEHIFNNGEPWFWYSNIEDKSILYDDPSRRKGFIISQLGTVCPSIIDIPKDNVFHLWNTDNVTIGPDWDMPGIYIIHKDLSETKYKPSNFEFKNGNILKAGEGLTFSNIDFSDCIMIGVGRVDMYID